MTNSLATIPDYLASLLPTEDVVDTSFVEPEYASERVWLPKIDIPQRISKLSGEIGNFVFTEQGTEEYEAAQTARLMLIDALVFSTKSAPGTPRNVPSYLIDDPAVAKAVRLPMGGRTMWELDLAGKRVTESERPVCGSDNGIAPREFYLNNEVLDPRTGEYVRIGYIQNGDALVQTPYACLTCPLGQWRQGEDGKRLAPVCSQTFSFVVYDVDRDKLFTLRGSNRSVQIALLGQTVKKDGDPARWDGTAFAGIESFFRPLPNDPTKAPYTPMGFPTQSTVMERPVFPVFAFVTQNNFGKASFVPDFVLCDGSISEVMCYGAKKKVKEPKASDEMQNATPVPNKPLTFEELGRFLAAKMHYAEEGLREKLMGMDYIRPHTFVHNPQLESGGTGKAALPAGKQTSPPWKIEGDPSKINWGNVEIDGEVVES